MNKTNYQKELDAILAQLDGAAPPRLLLHACCAPCSSYTLEYLSDYFAITVDFYNPNIAPEEEFEKRFAELQRLIHELPVKNEIQLVKGDYEDEAFAAIARGLEDVPEGGERCFRCYRLRLAHAAQLAKEQGFDYFCTTLSISPLKNAQKINEIGAALGEQYGVRWLPSDFKKREGYKRSIELSREYQLYRQNFCGCIYSKALKEKQA